MGKSIGVTDENYERVRIKAEEAGVSLMEVANACLAYGLDRLSVRLVISFSEVAPNGAVDITEIDVKRREDEYETPVPKPSVNAKPPHHNTGVATRLGPSAGTTEMVRQLLKERGVPMNVIEIRRALQEKYPNRVLSPNIGASIQAARGIRKNTDTLPHTYVYEP